ncbi:MAG: dihydroorotate dehydrogenase (quinone), partial [Elusimicrobiota bacterium]
EVSEMIGMLYPYADYLCVNVSSPNTPSGFVLGRAGYLRRTVEELKVSVERAVGVGRKLPLFVKLGPMLAPQDIDDAARALVDAGADGLVVTNSIVTPSGGLSGLPLREISLRTTARLRTRLRGKIPIISVGGILTPEDAWQRIVAGADLLEIFSGFVFGGPDVIKRILSHIVTRLSDLKMKEVAQASGMEADLYAR